DGGGFADTIEVADGTNVAALFGQRLPGRAVADYLVRVNRLPTTACSPCAKATAFPSPPPRSKGPVTWREVCLPSPSGPRHESISCPGFFLFGGRRAYHPTACPAGDQIAAGLGAAPYGPRAGRSPAGVLAGAAPPARECRVSAPVCPPARPRLGPGAGPA